VRPSLAAAAQEVYVQKHRQGAIWAELRAKIFLCPEHIAGEYKQLNSPFLEIISIKSKVSDRLLPPPWMTPKPVPFVWKDQTLIFAAETRQFW
jgi:hypothetical protein